ncbi:hypothetical protein MPSEU_000265800 [Mayamaea pseudoterrestris]|nr:hypothetical protein MPSEU_000265800 [Mayamaea pseudoterrestris]
MTIDPCDPQYQVSKDFQPDKTSTWTYPMKEDGWVLSHNALRNEAAKLKAAVAALQARGGVKEEWEIKALQTAAAAHLDHIHGHHSSEDDIMTPFITKRAKYPDRLTEDHDGIVSQLKQVETLVMAIKVNDNVDALLKTITDYEKDLLPHLAEEEEIGLPLLRAYFTPKEVKPQIAKIVKHASKFEIGSIVEACGTEFARKTFMPNEGIPFFVWYIDFYWKHRLFKKAFVNNVQALVDGVEPNAKKRPQKVV